MSDTTEVTATDETFTEVEAPALGIQDIQNALKIIDFAADQGAFKGWNTIQQVLAVRGKIAAFVAYAEANQPTEVTNTPAE